jgi:hypothetical protein
MAGDVPGTLAPVGRFAKRTYLSDRRVLVRPGRSGSYVRVFGDLISYQNDRKGCAMIAGKVESVSEHAAACIGMLTDQ